jgi:hypothetical protein
VRAEPSVLVDPSLTEEAPRAPIASAPPDDDWSDVEVTTDPNARAVDFPLAGQSGIDLGTPGLGRADVVVPPPAKTAEADVSLEEDLPTASLEELEPAHPAAIELPPMTGEPEEKVEMAPLHAFVPEAATTGHKPEPVQVKGPPAARPASDDGGEALLREALSKASREVIEKIAWEVVPQLAETIIREELDRLVKERQG